MFIVIFLRCDVQIKEHLDVYIFRKITEGHKFNVGKIYLIIQKMKVIVEMIA